MLRKYVIDFRPTDRPSFLSFLPQGDADINSCARQVASDAKRFFRLVEMLCIPAGNLNRRTDQILSVTADMSLPRTFPVCPGHEYFSNRAANRDRDRKRCVCVCVCSFTKSASISTDYQKRKKSISSGQPGPTASYVGLMPWWLGKWTTHTHAHTPLSFCLCSRRDCWNIHGRKPNKNVKLDNHCIENKEKNSQRKDP